MVEIKSKGYFEENSSKEEIEVIKKRVDYYNKDIILMREMPVPSSFVQKLYFEKLNEIIEPDQKFYLLIDLTEVILKIPDAEHRDILKNTFEYYKSQITHACVVVGTNMFMRLAAKIIMRNKVKSVSIHSNWKMALDKMSEIKKGEL